MRFEKIGKNTFHVNNEDSKEAFILSFKNLPEVFKNKPIGLLQSREDKEFETYVHFETAAKNVEKLRADCKFYQLVDKFKLGEYIDIFCLDDCKAKKGIIVCVTNDSIYIEDPLKHTYEEVPLIHF